MALTLSGTSGITGAGIGTIDSSGANVTGVGTFSADTSLSIADKIVHTGDTNTTIRFPSADTITAETGGTERLRINSSGQLGFGVSPSRHLDIKDSTGANRIVNVRGTGSSGAFIAFLDANTTDDSKCRVGSTAGNNLALRGDTVSLQNGSGTNKMVLDFNGNASVTGVTTAKSFVPTEGQLSHRNLIINGAMSVAQRATSSTSVGYVTVDRFNTDYGGENEAMTYTQHDLTSSDTGPWAEGFRHSFHVQNGNQTGGAGAGDYVFVRTKLEAQDLATSGWNYTSSSSYITLSFWVKSSVAQNFYGRLESVDGTAYNYPFETGSLSANTWTKITKTIPGNSNLQINNNNGSGMEFHWQIFRGTNFTDSGVSLDTWATYASGTRTPDATSTWWTTNDATWELTGVQLEVGSVATPFEHRSFGDELLLCQRYYQQLPTSGDHVMWGFGRAESNSARVQIPLSVPLRASPTITCSNNRSVKYDGTMVQSTSTPSVFKWDDDMNCIVIDFPSGGSLSHNNCYIVTSDSGTGGLQMSAEL